MKTSASQWFWQLIYFFWGYKWRSRRCSPIISPFILFVPFKPLNHILLNSILLSRKSSEIFSQIWAAPLFPLIYTSHKNCSFTSLESLSTYLTKVANSALSKTSVVSSAEILKSVAVIKRANHHRNNHWYTRGSHLLKPLKCMLLDYCSGVSAPVCLCRLSHSNS